MHSPVKNTWTERRRPIERPSILVPAVVWVFVVIAAMVIAWVGIVRLALS